LFPPALPVLGLVFRRHRCQAAFFGGGASEWGEYGKMRLLLFSVSVRLSACVSSKTAERVFMKTY
jgi:hypothetical protein